METPTLPTNWLAPLSNANHDLELSKMQQKSPDRFHNYCFEIQLSDEITYTYRITEGMARNQNATYLLKNILKEQEI